MEKKEYLRDMARDHWECGHPFSSDDFIYFQNLCKEDGFKVTEEDWNYYWNCFDDCRENYYDDDINEDELLLESGVSRHTYAGKSSSGGNTALGIIGHGMYRDIGASNLDFFGSHIIEEIKANLEDITCKVGGKTKLAIDGYRTELSIDKDPAPGESIKERRIRGWVYFKSNFNVIMEDRQVLKQKVIQAFKGGMVDFNDKYKSDYIVCKDMTLISESFKYGNDNKSMYFVFKIEEELFKGEKPKAVIIHKHSRESLDINDMFVQNAFPLTIDDNNVVITNATKPDYADYAGSNIGYYWWTEVEKESDASGPEECTTIYYFETPSDLNKYLRQHPEKEKLVLRRIYENTNSKNLFDSILRESKNFKSKRYYESYSDDLNEYQIDVIKDMAKMDIECGHPMDYDNALEACREDDDLSDVAEEAAQYYIRLVGEGAAACYEELKDEYDDWDPDFVAEFEREDDIPIIPSRETNINNTADWYKISQIEGLMYMHRGMSAEEAKKELGIDPSFKYIPTGNLN
jgi:hypothetical protein